jgi:hypothetical protein
MEAQSSFHAREPDWDALEDSSGASEAGDFT